MLSVASTRLPALAVLTSSLLLVLAGCGTAPPSPSAPAPAEPVRLRVIGFNDFHGNLEVAGLSLTLADPRQPGATMRVAVGGAAPMAGLVNALRAGSPHTLVLSAGDMVGAAPLVSTLFRHESTVDVMNRLGVSAAAPGNHEFDAGSAELARLVKGGCAGDAPASGLASCALKPYTGATFPVVAANVQRSDGSALFAPSWVAQVGPVKVGVIGAVTRGTPTLVIPSGVAGLAFADEAEAINRAAAALKAQGVHTLIVTMHEGGEIGSAQQPGDWNDERCPQLRGPIVDLAKRITPDVDLIVSGHTHQGYRCRIDGRLVVQSTSYGRGLSATDLVIDAKTGRVDRAAVQGRNLPVLNERTDAAQREALVAATPAPFAQALREAKPDAEVAREVGLFSAATAPRTQREIARIAGTFDRSGRNSSAGRLVADAQLAATQAPANGGAQIALMNSGGIRADLLCRSAPPCAVTYGDAFTMQPFGNSLVVLTLTGAELKALLEQQRRPNNGALLLQPSAGLRYRWLAKAPAGEQVQDLRFNGAPVQPGTEYRVAVNNFLVEGGDSFTVLRQGRNRTGGVIDLEALIEHLRQATRAPDPVPRIEWVD